MNHTTQKRLEVSDIAAQKGKTPLVCLTAYTAPFATILDRHADVLLVGDSVGMALYGMDSTQGVTVEMMVNHARAVVRASSHACVVVDLPYGSYEQSPKQALATARHVMNKTGAAAVKLEGGVAMQQTIRLLVDNGIPVMGHVGLLPQHVSGEGSYRYQGKEEKEAEAILTDAAAVEEAGAFSLVVEAVPAALAEKITLHMKIPVIGIGASNNCDGQILVTEDMAGLFTRFKPKFVRHYGQLAKALDKAASDYAKDVKARLFPAKQEML